MDAKDAIFDQTYPDSLVSAIQAVHANDTEALSRLASQGRSMRVSDNRGMTPLHYAALLGHTHCLDWLLLKGNMTGRQFMS